jgi:hypothetical protein
MPLKSLLIRTPSFPVFTQFCFPIIDGFINTGKIIFPKTYGYYNFHMATNRTIQAEKVLANVLFSEVITHFIGSLAYQFKKAITSLTNRSGSVSMAMCCCPGMDTMRLSGRTSWSIRVVF